MNRLIAIGGVIVLLAGGGLWWLTGQTSAPGLNMPSAASAQDAPVDLSLVKEMTLGEENAPVTVIEYASFTCPHCANFHATNFKKLKADYIDTGKVRFVYREVYFDQFGLWAGLLARCGDTTDKYFAISDMLYDSQAVWLASREPQGIAADLMKLGRQAGFTDDMLTACFQNRDLAQALVASYQENATRDGVNSTPTFVINGTTYTNMAWSDFQNILAEAGAPAQ